MSFTDPISNVSGRNSRASNVSGITVSTRSQTRPAGPQDTITNAGVLSMLKTSTDVGDIGALAFNHARLPTIPRPAHQRKGPHGRKLSGGSLTSATPSNHHYAPSQTSKVSSTHEWDSSSNPRRGSFTSMQSMPPSMPPSHLVKGASALSGPAANVSRETRSYSLTSAPGNNPLPSHRSQSSLRSQTLGSRQPMYPRAPPPSVCPGTGPMDPRPAYVYPTRLKRPGYRSASPALSDTYAPPGPPGPHPASLRRMALPPGSRPPPRTFNSDYAADYTGEPIALPLRAPPRMANSSPAPTGGYGEPVVLPYRNPTAARSAPGIPLQHTLQQPPPHPLSQYVTAQRTAYGLPVAPVMGYPLRPNVPNYGAVQQPNLRQSRGPHPLHPAHRVPPPDVAPMVHQMFHNAARMARHLPDRTGTPMTDVSPPSSDPPSSGTAPTSSSPPTPKDQTTIQVVVDPAFIDPALVDLPDSSSEPVLPHQYLCYADALEKDFDDPEMEVVHPSVPPSGFVQRVKAMLESKAIDDEAAKREGYHVIPPGEIAELHVPDATIRELHEMAANETPRLTMIAEFDPPAELPASPIKVAELAASPVRSNQRITREMVKAELGPSDSIDDSTLPIEPGDSTNIDLIIEHMRNHSREEAFQDSPSQDNQNNLDTHEFIHTLAHVKITSHGKSDMQSDMKICRPDPIVSSKNGTGHARRNESSTTTSEETQSKDPFILDADTITLQHQKSQDKSARALRPLDRDLLEATIPDLNSALSEGVSSLRPGEKVIRNSAVSPLHTLVRAVEETTQGSEDDHKSDDRVSTSSPVSQTSSVSQMPGAFPEEPEVPTGQRATKVHSKSVQLQSRTRLTDSVSSNRLSLPPDLSTIADSTMDGTSTELVTDVALRFSLPQTSMAVNRPQIVEIPASSSPEHPLQTMSRTFLQPTASRSKRNSVRFEDEITPLQINKNKDTANNAEKNGQKGIIRDISIVRRPSPLQPSKESSQLSHESTTDYRFINNNAISSKFGSTHLPGLKEESIEDMSISDKRALISDLDTQFSLPARIAAVKAMQERRLQESAEKAKERRANRHRNRPLADTRDLPSLNFSRMDLIDKLNQALETRTSQSMEIIRRRELSAIHSPSPQRPQSTEPLRERYMSFFSKPEDFSTFFEAEVENSEEDTEHIISDDALPTREPSRSKNTPTVEVQPSSEIEIADSLPRPLSPEELLNVASQVNRLSIPSVSGLSNRLSELLPNLRQLQLDSILAGFADEGRKSQRPETALSNRTSAGFRTLAERAEEIVKNGTHDSTVRKDMQPLVESASSDLVSSSPTNHGKSAYLSGSVSAPSDLGVEPARPLSALTRRRGPPTTADEVRELLPPEMNPITRNPKRALISSGSSRPWNLDENYPWAGSKVDVDLSVPSEVHTNNSIASEAIRRTRSLNIGISKATAEALKGIDIGSIIDHDSSTSLTMERLTGVSPDPKQKTSKVSVIGSITRKIGFQSRGGHDSSGVRSCISSGGAQSDSHSPKPHRPGERYPTSGLTPPGFNLDEVRSFFSDESSEEKVRHGSLRKRFTQLKARAGGKSFTLEPNRCQSCTESLDVTTGYDAGFGNMVRIGAVSATNEADSVGMSKTEFRIRRLGEKIRHLVAKGSQLIRSWSLRSKTPTPRVDRLREDWLSDSLYSGV